MISIYSVLTDFNNATVIHIFITAIFQFIYCAVFFFFGRVRAVKFLTGNRVIFSVVIVNEALVVRRLRYRHISATFSTFLLLDIIEGTVVVIDDLGPVEAGLLSRGHILVAHRDLGKITPGALVPEIGQIADGKDTVADAAGRGRDHDGIHAHAAVVEAGRDLGQAAVENERRDFCGVILPGHVVGDRHNTLAADVNRLQDRLILPFNTSPLLHGAFCGCTSGKHQTQHHGAQEQQAQGSAHVFHCNDSFFHNTFCGVVRASKQREICELFECANYVNTSQCFFSTAPSGAAEFRKIIPT